MTSHRRNGLLFILVGPTGAGKNTLMNAVMSRLEDLHQLPTATTRGIRPNEKEGREHHFLSRAAFEEMIENNELLEHQNVHGRLYGVPRKTVADAIDAMQDRIMDIDVLGAMNVRAAFPDNTIIVFVQPGASDDVVGTVRKRLEERGESPAEIENRLRRIPLEMSYAPLCDYLIIIDELNTAIESLYGIILAERSRRSLINLRARKSHPRHRLLQTSNIIVTHESNVLLHQNRLPGNQIAEGEYPIEAAERALKPDVTVTFGPLLGITMNSETRYDELAFWYHAIPVAPTDLPDGWAWSSVSEADIPIEIRNQLEGVNV